MKKIISILLLKTFLIHATLHATNYYFSSTDGDDSRTSTEAQNPTTPWQTLSKLNSLMSDLQDGDAVLFKSGDIFYGTLKIARSGGSGSPITFGSYGSGAKPVISGFYAVPSWTSLGGNLWSASIPSAPSMINMLTINGAFQPIGRWPKLSAANSGYLAYQSFSGTSSLTSNAMSGAAKFVGGEVVIRADHYNIDRGIISSQASSSVSYSMQDGGPLESLTNGFGFFFQNHPSACTQQGDWCFVPSSKTIEIYSSSTPSNINVSVLANNVSMSSSNYVTFQNLAFTGSNSAALDISNSNNINIESCDVSFAGANGISTNSACSNISVENSNLSYIMNNGIDCNSTTNWTISANALNHVGDIAGMGVSGDGQYVAMAYIGNNSTIQNNSIINCGYHGIQLGGSAKNFTVRNNFVQNFCLVKDDGGGIYTYKNTGSGTKIIQHNIVLDGIGAPNGTSNGMSGGGAIGIYSDGASDYLQVLDNTVANIQDMGFLTNDGLSPLLRGNTFYNCGTGGSGGGAAYVHWSGETPLSNLVVKKNIFVTKTAQQFTTVYLSNESSVTIKSFFGSSDSNYFAKPVSSNPVILTQLGAVSNLSVSQWQSSSGQDAHSKGSPITVTDASSIRFEYNATSSNKVVNLGATYMDVTGAKYAGSITLAPYSSAVLLYVSGTVANQPPVAKAGDPVKIALPVSLIVLDGTKSSDPDGTITSYNWSKISGPSSALILTPTLPVTTVNTLTEGVYQFELKVTDNNGAVGRDTVTITVATQGTANQAPHVSAGNPATIILPVSQAVLDGSKSSDADGTIGSYSWSEVSGPSSAGIVTPSLAVTTVTALTEGAYQFELKVVDNNGAVGRDTVTITVAVQGTANQPPLVNAGADQVLAALTDTTTLLGRASDKDGAITSIKWTQLSGPTCIIDSPNQRQTEISKLQTGVYTFELAITDNEKAVARDSVRVIVDSSNIANNKSVQVNLYGGVNPYDNKAWNNWNTTESTTSTALSFADGTSSSIVANISYGKRVADNSFNYAGTMAPPEVLRYTSYTHRNRTLTISGLSPSQTYSIELYASQDSTQENTTIFQVGENADSISTYQNESHKAVFSGLVPNDQGQLVIEIASADGINYLNGFTLTEIDSSTALRLKKPKPAKDDYNSQPPQVQLNTKSVFTLYPNPVTNSFTLEINNAHIGQMNIQIVSQSGAVVRSLSLTKEAELNKTNVAASGLAPGVYFINVKIGSWNDTKRFVKL